MNLILLQPDDFRDPGLAVLYDERARHIHKVLKAEPRKTLRIGLINGPLGTGTVLAIDSHEVCLQCVVEEKTPPKPRVDLLLAMPRPKVMKRLWAQIAALGVGRIVLVNADKVERYYFDSHVIEPNFYNKFLIEGLQQARCTHLPEVLVRPRFKPFIEDEFDAMFSNHRKLLADPSGVKRMGDFEFDAQRVLMAIGPEGGWTSYELEKLQKHGFGLFNMGSRILRVDTACVAAISRVNSYLCTLAQV